MKTWLARINGDDLSQENCTIEIFFDDYEVVCKPKLSTYKKLHAMGLLKPNEEFEITEKGEIQPVTPKEIPQWYEDLFETVYGKKLDE